MAAELWTRISTAKYEFEDRWETEIAWAASRKFTGVRVNIGMSADIRPDPSLPCDFTCNDRIFDLLTRHRLKCQLGIGGEGPRFDSDWFTWGGGAWDYPKRPILGAANAVVIATAETKSLCIERMFIAYHQRGFDPLKWCKVELGNEPARGGAGAPQKDDDYWLSGSTDFAIGTWDSTVNDPAPTLPTTPVYTTFCEYFNEELPLIELMDLPVIAPSFTSNMIDRDTNGISREIETCFEDSDKWLPAFRSANSPSWGINCYYDLQFAEVSLGPSLFAERVVRGRDLRLEGTTDVNAVVERLAAIRNMGEYRSSEGIVICEAGINPVQYGMNGSLGDRKRLLNYGELGRARLAYLDMLRELDVEAVILYTASDEDSTDLLDQYGVLTDEVGTSNDQTYAAEVAFGQRAGRCTSLPFAGDSYVLATGEVLPPRLNEPN